MTTAALAAFGLCFVIGPILCLLLLRMQGNLAVLGAMALMVAATTVLAMRLQAQGAAFASLGVMWLAWILAVTMVALAVRRRVTSSRFRRWVTIGALLATTLPWFGLATADLMV